ncbi:hypothetical protein SAMN04487983_103230 [Streptomyces sp. yr375]|uniref:hypothetical protein n=1 Tax=Streptomyces sp. yr375 TaxID=1761906 RepID=UPI0008CB3FC3|nr:hypothetical protein [Streptomyces sp. yr375]SES12809.1 hypothetical protein SAMN04487983_103230 [Streptomyces sp. yr375]
MPGDQSPDQHSDPFEERLSAALHHVGGTFDSPGGALAAAGQAWGQRLRLRRRRAAVMGGAASLALVGVGGALLVPWGGTPGPRPSSVAVPGSAEPTPVAASFTGDDMIRTLRQLLPQGKFSTSEARGTDGELPPLALGVYDDGKGEAAVSVGLGRIPADAGKVDPATAVLPCADGEQSGLDSCRTELLPDGSAITVYQGYEYPDRRADTKAWGADLVTRAGQHVSVMEWNSAAEKGKPISRPEPPLTPAQLKTLAAAPEWRRIADAIPEPRKSTATTGSSARPTEMSGTVILRKLALLLPADLKRVSHGSQETGWGYVVVDDGKGASRVEINVQPDMSDVADQLYGAGSETLDDGTRVAVRQGPGEKGGAGVVAWTVDSMRADGARVVVSAFNAAQQNEAATRAQPALTIGQLRAIALSPRWLTDQD